MHPSETLEIHVSRARAFFFHEENAEANPKRDD
jgi:hypothetical protein